MLKWLYWCIYIFCYSSIILYYIYIYLTYALYILFYGNIGFSGWTASKYSAIVTLSIRLCPSGVINAGITYLGCIFEYSSLSYCFFVKSIDTYV